MMSLVDQTAGLFVLLFLQLQDLAGLEGRTHHTCKQQE